MPWLVVTGNGSYGITLAREWVEPENDLAQGRWKYDTRTYSSERHRQEDGTFKAFLVEQAVRDKAEEEGYPDYVFFFEDEDEPELAEPDETGILTPDNIRSGTRTGVHLQVIEGEGPPEPVVDPEGLPLDFPCLSCERAFPSEGSLERHVEYDHTRRHEVTQRRAQRQAEAAKAEKDELRRLEQHEGKLPAWEREAVEQAQPKPPPPPVPSNEG